MDRDPTWEEMVPGLILGAVGIGIAIIFVWFAVG